MQASSICIYLSETQLRKAAGELGVFKMIEPKVRCEDPETQQESADIFKLTYAQMFFEKILNQFKELAEGKGAAQIIENFNMTN